MTETKQLQQSSAPADVKHDQYGVATTIPCAARQERRAAMHVTVTRKSWERDNFQFAINGPGVKMEVDLPLEQITNIISGLTQVLHWRKPPEVEEVKS